MRDPADLIGHVRFFAVLMLVIAICMSVEYTTGRNPFFVFGGVSTVMEMRGDHVRCMGPFRSSNLGGMFPATLFPLMVGLWFQDAGRKRTALIGIIACLAGTFFSNSSGPLLCLGVGFIGLLLWRMRDRMTLFRKGIVATLIVLQIVMKVPVWWVIAKFSDLVGGGGWHRAFIIDVCLRNLNTWWLIGYSHTITWAPDYQALAIDPENLDITNHYVAQAITGGIWMLGLFLAILTMGFKMVGRAVDDSENGLFNPIFLWSFGVCLATHCAAFFSVSYFDQIQLYWFWCLAALSCLWASDLTTNPESTKTAAETESSEEFEGRPGPTDSHAPA
jgi:hypothetical protein